MRITENRIQQLFKMYDILNKKWKNSKENFSFSQLKEKLSQSYASFFNELDSLEIDKEMHPADYTDRVLRLQEFKTDIKKSLIHLKKWWLLRAIEGVPYEIMIA